MLEAPCVHHFSPKKTQGWHGEVSVLFLFSQVNFHTVRVVSKLTSICSLQPKKEIGIVIVLHEKEAVPFGGATK